MKGILDTHVLLWAVMEPSNLSNSAREFLLSESSVKFVSIASVWELAIKVSLGKITLAERSFDELLTQGLDDTMSILLPIDLRHISRLTRLPFHHRDPFDRLLVAQALAEGVPLIHADATLDSYGVQRVW